MHFIHEFLVFQTDMAEIDPVDDLITLVKKVSINDACQIISDWNADISTTSHNSEMTKNSSASPERNKKVVAIAKKVKNGFYQFNDGWENTIFITTLAYQVYDVMKNPKEENEVVVGQIYFSTHDQFGENPRLPSSGIFF